MNLLRIWKASQTDFQRLVSNFLAKLEDGQMKAGANSLNALIAMINENVPRGKYLSAKINEMQYKCSFLLLHRTY